MPTPTIRWVKGSVKIIDQTKLPQKLSYLTCKDVESLCKAIRQLSVRGAPAIGVAAAYGVCLGMKNFISTDNDRFFSHLRKVCKYIGASRPTAVNLFNSLDEMQREAQRYKECSVEQIKKKLHQKAKELYETDRQVCRAMGKQGSRLIRSGQKILTICNAGALATVDYGTALGVIFAANEQGKKFSVFACETRPLLQGARLTTWELLREKIDTTLICDNMAATLMRQGKVDIVLTGADRIIFNGDTANKIGTYNLAVLAKYHNIPFYVVAPRSTFDMNLASGKEIPIEERSKNEVLHAGKQLIAPSRVKVLNPSFDVTKASLITGIVTEKGIIRSPYKKNIKKIFRT